MHQRKDVYFKDVMEYLFDELVRFVFKDANEPFDLEKKIIFMDKELTGLFRPPDSKTGTRTADKVAHMHLRSRKSSPVLVHLEVQDKVDKDKRRPSFEERMFCYFYRIWDRYQMPVVAIAILTGSDSASIPDNYSCECQGTNLRYQYRVIRIQDYSDEELSASDNYFALALMIARQGLIQGRNSDKKLLKSKIDIFKILCERGLSKNKKLEALFDFLIGYIPFKHESTNHLFKEQINLITQNKNDMNLFLRTAEYNVDNASAKGKIEGRNEGLIEGKNQQRIESDKRFVRSLLQQSDFSDQKIAEIVGCDIGLVKSIKNELI
ncbi:MAG: hypothetical protein QM733_24685 [Ilumatobacteraceae bacterium]